MSKMHLQRSGEGKAARTACGRDILRTPMSVKWMTFVTLPDSQVCMRCRTSAYVKLLQRQFLRSMENI
jgi:hypothetical protein